MAGGADRLATDRGTPLMDARGLGLLMPVARNRSRFIEIAIHLRQSRPDIPCPETAPSFSTTGTWQKICDRGRLPWRNPA